MDSIPDASMISAAALRTMPAATLTAWWLDPH
jgi:hypothetical protein